MTRTAGYGRNAGKRWRYDDVKALRQLIASGAPVRLISLRLGRPDNAILAKAESLNLHLDRPKAQIAPPPVRTLSRDLSKRMPSPDLASSAARQDDLFATMSA